MKVNLIFVLILHSLQSIVCINLCQSLNGNWTQYSDSKELKCFSLLSTKENVTEAEKLCQSLEGASQLPSLHSIREQQFIIEMLIKSNNPVVWLGLHWQQNSSQWKWSDNSGLGFQAWSGDPPTNAVTTPNVTLETSSGQWKASDGHQMAAVVCQKTMTIDLMTLFSLINDGQFIPVGFIYTQLSNQMSAEELYPRLKWRDVTAEYAGLFFRAEGGGASPFGQNQAANQTWISHVNATGFNYTGWDKLGGGGEPNLKNHFYPMDNNGKWNRISPGGALLELNLFGTGGESVPNNTAIRLWKREG